MQNVIFKQGQSEKMDTEALLLFFKQRQQEGPGKKGAVKQILAYK